MHTLKRRQIDNPGNMYHYTATHSTCRYITFAKTAGNGSLHAWGVRGGRWFLRLLTVLDVCHERVLRLYCEPNLQHICFLHAESLDCRRHDARREP